MNDDSIKLIPMTDEMYHVFFREYENDPDLYIPGQEYVHYEYCEDKIDRYVKRQRDLNRVTLAILCDDEIVGEVIIKNIEKNKCATMGIALKNAKFKDHGIGTAAERLAVRYVFYVLDIPTIYADAVRTNTRSQHVLEKAGFSCMGEDRDFKYYRIDREPAYDAGPCFG